jgi:hypothetical protein
MTYWVSGPQPTLHTDVMRIDSSFLGMTIRCVEWLLQKNVMRIDSSLLGMTVRCVEGFLHKTEGVLIPRSSE